MLIRGDLNVRAMRPPVPLPTHTVNLLWHERFTQDPAHRWLRKLVAETSGPAQPVADF